VFNGGVAEIAGKRTPLCVWLRWSGISSEGLRGGGRFDEEEDRRLPFLPRRERVVLRCASGESISRGDRVGEEFKREHQVIEAGRIGVKSFGDCLRGRLDGDAI